MVFQRLKLNLNSSTIINGSAKNNWKIVVSRRLWAFHRTYKGPLMRSIQFLYTLVKLRKKMISLPLTIFLVKGCSLGENCYFLKPSVNSEVSFFQTDFKRMSPLRNTDFVSQLKNSERLSKLLDSSQLAYQLSQPEKYLEPKKIFNNPNPQPGYFIPRKLPKRWISNKIKVCLFLSVVI